MTHKRSYRITAMVFNLVWAATLCAAQDGDAAQGQSATDVTEQEWRGRLARPQATIDRGVPGVLVRIYDVGEDMRSVPTLVPGQLPNVSRVVSEVDLDGARGDFDPLKDRFVTEVTGFINVASRGRYIFRLLSDDGAQLWINEQLVIDHDGLHGPEPKNGEVELAPGQNPFRILHFDANGGERLALMWKVHGTGSGDAYAVVPAALLTYDHSASRETSPGRKRIVPPLRSGLPGDGSPLAGLHPSYELKPLDPDALDGQESEALLRTLRTTARLGVCNTPQGDLIKTASAGGDAAGAQLQRVVPRNAPTRDALKAWLPPDPGARRPSTPCVLRAGDYVGQVLIGDALTGTIWRVFLDEQAGGQGCVFRFRGAGQDEVHALVAASDGDIIVAGPSLNVVPGTGEPVLHALVPTGQTTFEMIGLRALSNGFEIEFTKPLDQRIGWDPQSYYVEQWPYGVDQPSAPARDGTTTPVKSASVSPDRRRVFLEIEGLKPAHVVYLRLLPPCLSEDGQRPWSTEAWYTLKALPEGHPGTVLPPPAKEPQNVLCEEERAAGWKLLFDGKTTKGWRGYKKEAFPDEGWQVKDGCLVRVGPGGDIATIEQFDNFELAIEWRISAGGNSGVFFRVDEQYGWPWDSGPEMQVLDNAEHQDGRNPKTSAGSNYALHAPVRDVTQPVGLFNQARILVADDHVEHWLNGVKIVEYQLGGAAWEQLVAESKFSKMPNYGRTKKGHIVLQDHGNQVWYRNIKIRELPGE